MKQHPSQVFKKIATTKSVVWSSMQEAHILGVFRKTARCVPAYRQFLKTNNVKISNVTSPSDVRVVPPISKKNYIRKWSWKDLVLAKILENTALVMTSTSGSTGKPVYFPRTSVIDEQACVYHQIFIRNSQLNPDEPTLVIVGFGMGVWIGGIITYESFKRISERGFPLTILTPGVNKKEIYDALREIGPYYTQLILCGYPPFIKDVIDDGPEHGVTWHTFNMRIVCAAEGFSEDFRQYLMKKTGMKNRYRDIMNIYGSAELGTMATETPLAILIREHAIQYPDLFVQLFGGATRLPTLAQYIPTFVSFEAEDNTIYCTADNALPLVRYEIGDHGGVFTFTDVETAFSRVGLNLRRAIKSANIADTISELPFVFVYERADLSTKLYGAIIYPEHIRSALHHDHLSHLVTGRFTMFTKNDKNQNEYLEINIELMPKIRESAALKEKVTHTIMKELQKKNAEYNYLLSQLGDRVRPIIVSWAHNDPTYFSHGGKHAWVKK